jgi:hypothetical protein
VNDADPIAPDVLTSWRPGPIRQSIVDFVGRVTGQDGSPAVPVEERVAVFDNDGTLWVEKPMPIQLDFILRRLVEMAAADASLRDRQPWKAAFERDLHWFGGVVARHYAGDDAELPTLAGGILAAFAGMSVEEFETRSAAFIRAGVHPTLGRGYLDCAYLPMVELLRYLDANGFTSYIASGGGRDFMRPVSQSIYGIPRERVIGSTPGFVWSPSDDGGGTVTHAASMDYLDDGPQKPIRIWSRVGRRPLLAGGNSNGDIQMLQYTNQPGRPSLRLLVLHDDPEREFDYVGGAEQALELARTGNWTVVSIKDHWATVFADATALG